MPNFCAICGEDDPRVLKEHHHPFGKGSTKEKILLCHNCHDKITKIQNKLPPFARKKTAPKILKRAYALMTFASLLGVYSNECIKFFEEFLEEYKKCQK